MLALALILTVASELVSIRDGNLPAPGRERCVRLHASGDFESAKVRVNNVFAGELTGADAELDITGYLSLGAENTVEVRAAHGSVERVWALVGPLVYLASTRFLDNGEVEVTVRNTTENTAQVEIGEQRFTVSPGTSVTRTFAWTAGWVVRMRAVSDGLDREFLDESAPKVVKRH